MYTHTPTCSKQRQAAVLAQWAALGPKLRASEVFRRHEAGGRVGVLMSVLDDDDGEGGEGKEEGEEEEGGLGLRFVQASNAAYDRILAKPLQMLRDSIYKRCLLAFTIGS